MVVVPSTHSPGTSEIWTGDEAGCVCAWEVVEDGKDYSAPSLPPRACRPLCKRDGSTGHARAVRAMLYVGLFVLHTDSFEVFEGPACI